MNLLAGTCYDPAAALTKSTAALLVMTALDTTNLRLAITVPAHGMIRVRLAGTLHGATTCPQILFGVMNGSTVLRRMSPMYGGTNIAATSMVKAEADFIVTGLTPGAMNVDAAYGVETVVASTGLKYGGPNNTTANDAFGGFVFEIYDPQSLKVGLGGGVNMTQCNSTTQTARDLGAQLDQTVGSRLPTANYSAPLDAVGTRTALGMTMANLDSQLAALASAIATRLADADYTDPPSATEIRNAIFARMVSDDLNFLQAFQLHSATLLGKNYGAGTLTRGFRDLDDTLNAIVGTFDVTGPNRNRVSVVYDPPPAP